MKLIYKIVILSIISFTFSLGMSFADSNVDENNNTKELNNLKNEMTELEELNTTTSLSMDKEIAFPRDI